MIAAASAVMFLQQIAHEVWRNNSAVEEALAQQTVVHQLAQRSAKPVIDGDTKAHFRPRQQLRRQAIAKRFQQNPFALAVLPLPTGGNASSEFGEAVVQQRTADLQRSGHGGAIHLCQKVTSKQIGRLKVHQLGADVGTLRQEIVR